MSAIQSANHEPSPSDANFHPEMIKAMALFPSTEKEGEEWVDFLTEELILEKTSPQRSTEIANTVVYLFRSQNYLAAKGIPLCRKLIDAFIDIKEAQPDKRFPPAVSKILYHLEWKIGFDGAFKCLKNADSPEMEAKFRVWTLQSLTISGNLDCFFDLFQFVTTAPKAAEPLPLDDFFVRPNFMRLLEDAFSQKKDDEQFYSLFFDHFALKVQPIRLLVYRGLVLASMDLTQFERHFAYMRRGGIIADLKKYPLEIVEEKIRDRRDLQILLDILLKKPGNKMDEIYSLCTRHKIQPTNRGVSGPAWDPAQVKYIEPILRKVDFFAPTSFNLGKEKRSELLFCEDFGVPSESLVWVGDLPVLQRATAQLLKARFCAFDSEFYRESYGPFEQQQLALMQLYDGKNVFLIDCLALKGSTELAAFIREFFESTYIIKAGLGLQSDFNVLEKTLKLTKLVPEYTVDLAKGAKSKEMVSLKTLCEHFFKKQLCKYEQASAWGMRPLRQGQLHYAALDAVVVYKLVEIMAGDVELSYDQLTLFCGESVDAAITIRAKKEAQEASSNTASVPVKSPPKREKEVHEPVKEVKRPVDTVKEVPQSSRPTFGAPLSKRSTPFHKPRKPRKEKEDFVWVAKTEDAPKPALNKNASRK